MKKEKDELAKANSQRLRAKLVGGIEEHYADLGFFPTLEDEAKHIGDLCRNLDTLAFELAEMGIQVRQNGSPFETIGDEVSQFRVKIADEQGKTQYIHPFQEDPFSLN